jgi:ABC-type sugar transport system ATPase subunit
MSRSEHQTDSSGQLAPAIEVRGAHKTYSGARALRGVDLTVAPGEVRALLGKNGAGKSTLVEVMAGSVNPDAGEILINGRRVEFSGPADALALGVATVHQELTVVPELSVAENVFLGRWAATSGSRYLRYARLNAAAKRVLDRLDVDISPHERVGNLSIAEQQMVEIARGLSADPTVLILDEPTSSLAAGEVDVLIDTLRRLAGHGVAIIYVSHRMDEIPRVADSLTVLRDGQLIGTEPARGTSTAEVVQMMTGGVLHSHRAPRDSVERPTALRVEGLRRATVLDGVDLTVGEGEVVGLAGLLGSGRTELLECIAGSARPSAGTMTLRTRPHRPRSVKAALRSGVGLVPEDRKREGLALDLSVSVNLCLASPGLIRRGGLLSGTAESRVARRSVDDLHIKVDDLARPVRTLSGGNQQKVVLGKCLNAGSRLLLLDEPTRGVDVEAKEQIYTLIRDLVATGASVIVASSEIEELFLVCDRIVCLKAGRVVSDLPTSQTTVAQTLVNIMEGTKDE